jgi:CheY-like chemotaxis protein
VLINLLSNAGRFTEKGGVLVTLHHEEDMILVSVADTGLGIALDDQKRLFEPFYQVDSSLRRNYGGSGLGLNISKQFVEMHRGKMWLESELGVGTTFYFSLPLQPPLPASLSTADGIRYNPYAQFDGRAEESKAPALRLITRYIVLEEGNTLQQMFARYRDDVEVVAVQDMASALQELSHSPAHALLINPASFSTQPAPREPLVSLPYGTPVITCSVVDEEPTTQPIGAARYLIKPVSCEALLATLADLGNHIETVLIVDDDRELLQLFTRMLSTAERPYRVLQTTSGQRALSLLRERHPDVMLLDLMMPKLDGFEVLEQKGQDPSIAEIPTIIVSAKDPVGHPIVSPHLTVTYKDGLSTYKLMACIQAISKALFPNTPSVGQVHPEKQTL